MCQIKVCATKIQLGYHKESGFKSDCHGNAVCACSIFAVMSAGSVEIAIINKADYYHEVVLAALYFSSINRLHFDGRSKVQVLLFLQMVAGTRVLFPLRTGLRGFFFVFVFFVNASKGEISLT